MSSIEGGYLLSSVRQTAPVQPVQRTQEVEKKEPQEVPEVAEQPIVEEAKAKDRYDQSTSVIDVNTMEQLQSQSRAVGGVQDLAPKVGVENNAHETKAKIQQTVDITGPGEQQVHNPVAVKELSNSVVSLNKSTDTVADHTAELVSDMRVNHVDYYQTTVERKLNPDTIWKEVQRVQEDAVKSEPEVAPTAEAQHNVHIENASHTQNAVEFQNNQQLIDQGVAEVTVENTIPDRPDAYNEEIRVQNNLYESYTEADYVDTARQSTTWDTPVETQVKVDYEAELQQNLQAEARARTEIMVQMPNTAQQADLVPSAVEPVYSERVPEQRIETGPLPTVASETTGGAVNEAMASPQDMKSRYEAVEIQTQPAVEVETPKEREAKKVDTHTETPIEHTQAQAKSEQPQAPVAEPVEIEPIELPEVKPYVAPEPVKSQIQEVESSGVEGFEEVVSDAKPVEDYFAPLPGSGDNHTEFEEIAAPIAGSGETNNQAQEFFAPLPGSGETVVANTEDYFPDLPGTSQVDGSGGLGESQTIEEFMAENPLPGSNYSAAETISSENKPDLQDFLGEGVEAISTEELAYRQATGVAENYWSQVEQQFGGNVVDNSDYDPFQVQGEQWVRDASNFDGRNGLLTSSDGDIDLSQFEEAVPEVTDNSIELAEYLDAQRDRVIEYEMEETGSNPRDLADLFR